MVWQSSTNEDTAFPWWYDEGTPLSRTCFIFGHGMWPTQEPPCRFQIINLLSNFSIHTVFAICQLVSSSTGHGDGTFSVFLGSLHRPIPVRCNWSVFARKMHSTSEFAKIVLSKCVIHVGFVTVAWTLRRMPFQVGERMLDLIFEFKVFNLVICLSKVKQLAIFRVSPVACRFVKQWAAVLGFTFFSWSFDLISEFTV